MARKPATEKIYSYVYAPQKFPGTKWPGSELARVLLADLLLGANWPGSTKARYHDNDDCVCVESSGDHGRRQRRPLRNAAVHLHRQSSESGQDGCRPPCCRWQSTPCAQSQTHTQRVLMAVLQVYCLRVVPVGQREIEVCWDVMRYGDGAGNTVEKNSSVFSLIQMH